MYGFTVVQTYTVQNSMPGLSYLVRFAINVRCMRLFCSKSSIFQVLKNDQIILQNNFFSISICLLLYICYSYDRTVLSLYYDSVLFGVLLLIYYCFLCGRKKEAESMFT